MKRFSPQKIEKLNQRVNGMAPVKILEFIKEGYVTLDDLKSLDPDKRRLVEGLMGKRERGERKEDIFVEVEIESAVPPEKPAPESAPPVIDRRRDMEELIKTQLRERQRAEELKRLQEEKRRQADLERQRSQDELGKMRKEGAAYPMRKLQQILASGKVAEEQLISSGLASEFSLQLTKDYDRRRELLPDIFEAISMCKRECELGRTDVFFLGIPSTGKSCILMGLMGCQSLNANYVKSGGPYAAALYQYLKTGITVNQTPADFVATVEVQISGRTNFKPVNLIEMSGEEFATTIANNPDAETSFNQMGGDAAQLLSGDNHKIIFLIVDPTAQTVSFNRATADEDGPVRNRKLIVDQYVSLKRMIDMFALPQNASVMMKVEAIHFIVTKADTLGSPAERDKKAYELFLERYQSLIDPLIMLCRKYAINYSDNPSQNGVPNLYTFSLGNFFPGGIVEYNPKDSNKLIGVIDSLSPANPNW